MYPCAFRHVYIIQYLDVFYITYQGCNKILSWDPAVLKHYIVRTCCTLNLVEQFWFYCVQWFWLQCFSQNFLSISCFLYIPTSASDLFTSFTPLCSIIYQTHQTKYSSVQYSMNRVIHTHLSLLLTEHSYLKSCGIKIILFIKLL